MLHEKFLCFDCKRVFDDPGGECSRQRLEYFGAPALEEVHCLVCPFCGSSAIGECKPCQTE